MMFSCVKRDSALEDSEKSEMLSVQINLFTEGSDFVVVSIYEKGEKKESMEVSSKTIRSIFAKENVLPIYVKNKIMTEGSIKFKSSKGVLWMGKLSGSIFKIDHTYFQLEKISGDSKLSEYLLE